MYDLVVFLFLAAVVVCAGVGGWLVVRLDPRRPAFAFGVFMLLMGLWSASHVGTLSSSTQLWHLRYTQLSYVSVVLAPVAWLVFALRYRDRGELVTRRRLGLLLVVPAVTLVAVFTAQDHSLFYASMDLTVVDGRPMLSTTSGPWHTVNVAYSYALLLVGTGLLVESALTDNRLYRRQSAVLLACLLFPWFVNAAYHVGLRPVPWVDTTPLAFTVVGIPLAGVVVRTDLATFLPVAHERVFRTLEDPVVVATPEGRIVDANRAAGTVFDADRPLEGTSVASVLPDELCDGDSLDPALDTAVECSLILDGERRQYVARRRALDPGPEGTPRGHLVWLVDITVQKDQQRRLERKTERLEEQTARLERKNEQLERLADIAAHDLRGPLATAEQLRELIETDLEDPSPAVDRSLADLATVHERLGTFADHLPDLARESTDVEETDPCDLDDVARSAWSVLATGEADLVVAETREITADRRRLHRLFENLFRNSVEHGSGAAGDDGDATSHPAKLGPARSRSEGATDGGLAGGAREGAGTPDTDASTDYDEAESVTTVRVGATDGGFYVADDGTGIPPGVRETVFEYGTSTGDGSGFGLAIVRSIVEAHGWTVELTEGTDGGARFEVRLDE